MSWPAATYARTYELQQSLGVRKPFLRLPELAPRSARNKDARTDIAFAGGLLFFLLTGLEPHVVIDADGKALHQRPGMPELLHAIAGDRTLAVADVFDRTMATRIDHRYNTADEVLAALDALSATRPGGSASDDLALIRSVMDGRVMKAPASNTPLWRTHSESSTKATGRPRQN